MQSKLLHTSKTHHLVSKDVCQYRRKSRASSCPLIPTTGSIDARRDRTRHTSKRHWHPHKKSKDAAQTKQWQSVNRTLPNQYTRNLRSPSASYRRLDHMQTANHQHVIQQLLRSPDPARAAPAIQPSSLPTQAPKAPIKNPHTRSDKPQNEPE